MQPRTLARGFSMLEVLVVLGMFAIVAGFGLFVSMETFRGSNFHSDRDLLVALLQRARAQAVNNMCTGSACTDGVPHGVHIETDKYVLFQGSAYSSSDPLNSTFSANPSVTRPASQDVIFAQLTGNTSATSIALSGGGRSSTISISAQGQITWDN